MLRDVLRLVRAPLAATAIADGVAGYLLATVRFARAEGHYASLYLPEPIADPKPLVLVALASTALYWAGMALNDWFDLERDKKLYPFRPLPSGKISTNVAALLGVLLLAAGIGAAFAAGGPRAALTAALTAAAILAYDGLLKRWRLPGSLAMGLCRTGNVELGASVALAHTTLGAQGVAPLHLQHALAIGIYVFSLTLLSTFEDEDAPAAALLLGFAGVLSAPIVLALAAPPATRLHGLPLLAAHAALVLVLAVRAARRGTKATGHVTTRWLLRALLLLDAGVVAAAGFPLLWAGGLLALIVPNLIGARILFAPKKPG